MKKTLIVALIAMLALSGTAMAQKTIKLGHVNSTELMQIMPGRDSAQNALQAEVAELENTLKAMQGELEQRYNEFQEKQSQWSDLIKQTKQRELQDMGTRIEEFQQNAQAQESSLSQETTLPEQP